MKYTGESGAVFSDCRTWRYVLWRRWSDAPMANFIGLNPSTADETEDDPTIRRCIGFAKSWEAGGIFMTNIFAFRSTDPKGMKAALDPVGPENDAYLKEIAGLSEKVVACWGAHGKFQWRGAYVRQLIGSPLLCFGKTSAGQPRHPLYLAKTTALVEL